MEGYPDFTQEVGGEDNSQLEMEGGEKKKGKLKINNPF